MKMAVVEMSMPTIYIYVRAGYRGHASIPAMDADSVTTSVNKFHSISIVALSSIFTGRNN